MQQINSTIAILLLNIILHIFRKKKYNLSLCAKKYNIIKYKYYIYTFRKKNITFHFVQKNIILLNINIYIYINY